MENGHCPANYSAGTNNCAIASANWPVGLICEKIDGHNYPIKCKVNNGCHIITDGNNPTIKCSQALNPKSCEETGGRSCSYNSLTGKCVGACH